MLKALLKPPVLYAINKLSNNPWVQRYYEGQGVIFMLHRVIDTQEKLHKDAGISMAFLDSFITLLKTKGFSFVSLDEICDLLLLGKRFLKVAHFTLDDGFKCTLTNALPVFKAHSVPFTTYICTGLIDRIEANTLDWSAGLEMLNWEDVKTLHQEQLCTIGSHTQSHPKLAQIRERERVIEEIQGARVILKRHLGEQTRHFAYPYGSVEAVGLREVEIVQELGLKSAVTTRRGTLYPQHKDFLACLPRVNLLENLKLHEIYRLRKHRIALL